jgi:hypothetical protein
MNEVGHTSMYSIVMTLMAKRQSIGQFMAQFREVSCFFDVMCFKFSVSTAMLALEVVTVEYLRLPCQIFRASSSLILFVVFTLAYSLTCPPTIDMIIFYQLTRTFNKDFPTYFASAFTLVLPTFLRAISFTSNHCGWAFKFFATYYTCNLYSLQVSLATAYFRAIPFLSVHIPITVGLFRDDCTACFTRLQPFRVKLWLTAWTPIFCTCLRTIRTHLIILQSFFRIIGDYFFADFTNSLIHKCSLFIINLYAHIIANGVIKCQAQ